MLGGTAVAKREWGAKHTCMGCGVKFYDLHRRPITCPKCGSVIEIASVPTNRRRASAIPEPSPPANDDNIVASTVHEGSGDDDGEVIDDIGNDDDDGLVEDIRDGEPTQAES